MNSLRFFFLMCFVAMIAACSGDQGKPATQGQPLPGPTTFPPPGTNTNTTSLPTSTGNVQHYTCPNNCEGSGGGGAGTCPVCGTEYTHNAAFHSQTATPPPSTTTTITPPSDGATPLTPATPPATTSSAVNASGVYHYSCPSGCEGGAASAGACATCGGELTHNPAFHQ
jgi:hypothetical protein